MFFSEASANAPDRSPRDGSVRQFASDSRSGMARPQSRDARSQSVRRTSGLPFVTITTASGQRVYAIHPVLWLGGALLATSLSIGGIAAGAYMAFHDDIVEFAITRPIRMEQAYEDRIAALRSEIDRINSRQLIDQDAFETKIAALMTQQDALKTEQTRITALLSRAHDQNIHLTSGPVSNQLGPDLTPTAAIAKIPVPEQPRPLDGQPFRSSWLFGSGESSSPTTFGPAAKIARVEAEIDQIKASDVASIAQVTGLAETNARLIERVVGRLGLKMADESSTLPARQPGSSNLAQSGKATAAGVGGPLVPVIPDSERLTHAEMALERLKQLKQGINLLPLGQPITGEIEVTSPFGERPDPFLGIPAMHTGIDFRAAYGEPVTATGAGIVTEASRQGGYGNLVEIDHGNGLATRYGHLSQFAVTVGQKVRVGQIVGFVGSTGRSTAPHIHYETRVNGVAVNPDSYLQAGSQLRAFFN